MSKANKKIALQQIHQLFQLAKTTINEDEKLAQRYIAIARKISMASRVRLPLEYRRQICKGCKKLILPGINCRVRLQQRREPHITVTCKHCGEHMRFPIPNKEKA